MENTALLKKLKEYGADMAGITDRFVGDSAFYESCFRQFLADDSFAALKTALAASDYPQAFTAAHALKGLCGNMGVTPCYQAVCALVEALRVADYAGAAALAASVWQQYDLLQKMLAAADQEKAALPDERNR